MKARLWMGVCVLLAACGGSNGETGTQGGGGGSSGNGGGGGGSTEACTAARDQAIAPIEKVSTGAVDVLSTDGAVRSIYVDATAGGIEAQAENPWIYVSLAKGTKISVTDGESLASDAWDLALKRALLRTNGGSGGPGDGGAVFYDGKSFDDLGASDAEEVRKEAWFDGACNLKTDMTGAPATTFAGWYDYNPATHQLSPREGTFIVRGGDGALYEVAIVDYYATPDGKSGTDSGAFRLEVALLK